MKALCNHFARKINARYEGNKGYTEFGDGKCKISTTSRTLTFQAESHTAEGLEHVRRAVGNHLGRFTPGEEIQINWKDHS